MKNSLGYKIFQNDKGRKFGKVRLRPCRFDLYVRRLCWLLMVVSGIVLNGAGCLSTGKNQPSQEPKSEPEVTPSSSLEKLYLDEMPKQLAAASNRATTFEVKGKLPNPAYRLDHVEVKVRGRVIEITPWAQVNHNVMVVQIVVPYSEKVEVGPLAPGEYTVRFVSRSGVQEARLEVK